MSTVLVGSLSLVCSCSSAVAFGVCPKGIWKTFIDGLTVVTKGSVGLPQLDVAPESTTMNGRVPLRMLILVALMISFSFFKFRLFNSSGEWGLTQITQWCLTYFSFYLVAIISTVEIMFGPPIPSFLGVTLLCPFLVFPVFLSWWSVMFILV